MRRRGVGSTTAFAGDTPIGTYASLQLCSIRDAAHLSYIRCTLANSFILFECVDRPLFLVIALLAAYGHLATWSLPIIHFEDVPKCESNAAVTKQRDSLRRSDAHASVTGVTSLGTVEHSALLVDVVDARQATCKHVVRKLQFACVY